MKLKEGGIDMKNEETEYNVFAIGFNANSVPRRVHMVEFKKKRNGHDEDRTRNLGVTIQHISTTR